MLERAGFTELSSTFLRGFSMLKVFMVVLTTGVRICLLWPLLSLLNWGCGVLGMMEGMLVMLEGRDIESSERSERGEEDLSGL